jgi:hypothetical protein
MGKKDGIALIVIVGIAALVVGGIVGSQIGGAQLGPGVSSEALVNAHECTRDGTCEANVVSIRTGTCSELGGDVLAETIETSTEGRTLILKELEILHRDYNVVIPGFILKLSNVKNNTQGHNQDRVDFKDRLTGDIYRTAWIEDGRGTISIGGKTYRVTLDGDSQTLIENYNVTLDYPHTSFPDAMDLSLCF